MSRIAHFGTFDVNNYGDLLFPLIAEYKLRDMGELVHISPLGGRAPYEDVPTAISLDEAFATPDFDSVLIGGGNIVHPGVSSLPEYRRVRYSAYPGLWAGAAALQTKSRATLVTNAPGVPNSFSAGSAKVLRKVVAQASYFSVRDATSAARIEAAGAPLPVVVPDSALQIAEVLGPAGDPGLGRYIAVHLNDRYLTKSDEEIAARLDLLASRLHARIALIAIGPCHGDDELAVRIARQMKSEPHLELGLESVTRIAHLIAAADFYVGSSLHGFITATSYGKRAFLVVGGTRQTKFAGLLEELGAPSRMFFGWDSFFEVMDEAYLAAVDVIDLTSTNARLDAHWEAIRDAVAIAPKERTVRRVDVHLVAAINRGKHALRHLRNAVRR